MSLNAITNSGEDEITIVIVNYLKQVFYSQREKRGAPPEQLRIIPPPP